jgi:hypothetical protein
MAAAVGGRWPLMLRTGWVKKDARVALWDVSHAGRWDSFIGAEITDAILHYRPMPNDGYWCLRIALSFDGQLLHLMLGEADGDHQLALLGRQRRRHVSVRAVARPGRARWRSW